MNREKNHGSIDLPESAEFEMPAARTNGSPEIRPLADSKAGGAISPPKYLDALKKSAENNPGISSLDRSEFFRHKKDFEIFAEIIRNAKSEKPLKFLAIGVGNMEEPISYLAAAYSAAEGRPLENVVDLEMVEIQSKAEVTPQYRLGKQLFAPDRPIKPKMYEDSFALVDGEYEPNEAIKKYLSSRIADETKTHFGLPVENFSETVQEQFDVVSCNNVIQHLGGIEDYSSPYKNTQGEQDYARYYEELAKILNQVKAGGVLFIHAPAPGDKFDAKSQGVKFILDKIPNFENEFEELKPAVYRRKIKT